MEEAGWKEPSFSSLCNFLISTDKCCLGKNSFLTTPNRQNTSYTLSHLSSWLFTAICFSESKEIQTWKKKKKKSGFYPEEIFSRHNCNYTPVARQEMMFKWSRLLKWNCVCFKCKLNSILNLKMQVEFISMMFTKCKAEQRDGRCRKEGKDIGKQRVSSGWHCWAYDRS